MKEMYTLNARDAEGVEWVFEGTVQGLPIFVEKKNAKAKLMTFHEAEEAQMKHGYLDESYTIERAY
jgi:hypothetical protein